MTDDAVVFVVIFAIANMVIGGIFALTKTITWFEHQRGVMPLDVLVKDIENVEGHLYCAKCSDPLRVYAVSTGYDTKTAKELFKKFGRCDHWRWWRGGAWPGDDRARVSRVGPRAGGSVDTPARAGASRRGRTSGVVRQRWPRCGARAGWASCPESRGIRGR